jgi:signal transduction histidine kinase
LIFALVLALSPLRGRLQRTAERLFERERGRYEETVRAASEALVSLLPLGDLLDRVLWAVTGPMGVEGAVVLLRSGPRGDYSPAAARARSLPEGWRIPAEHPLVKLVWAYRDGLSREDLALRVLPEALAGCQEVFRELDAGLILPLAFGVDLRGLLAVGTRRGLEPFRTEERQILRTLANQAAVAIENALAYDEIARLNQSLESRIEARTRELREAQAALAEREKMASLGQLVAGVAHEINNPVALVHSNLALLGEQVERLVRAVDESDPSAAARAREHLARLVERSLEGTRRIGGIVRALRTFSRVDQPELGEADLLEGLETTLALLSPRLHGIEVIREIEPLPKVRCHAGQIHQVLMNLLLNACDAGATRIVIRAAARGERVWIEVEDNGAGIPPENRPRLFEPFFTTKGVGEGTGLGLAISHGIVERHGGRIRLARSGREGTAFEMEIPISGPPPEAAPAASVARS